MRLLTLTIILGLMSSLGCNSNPYPGEGVYTPKKQEEKPQLPNYGLVADDVVDLYEGIQGEARIKGWVPPPGSPVIKFDRLPAGARFDEAASKLLWTPPYEAANDPNDSAVTVKAHKVTVRMTSSENSIITFSKEITLLVHDSPRNFTLDNFASSVYVNEGQTLEQGIRIKNEDFAKGPFKIFVNGLPRDVEIVADRADSSHFTLKWTPDYLTTTRSDGYKTIDWQLQVMDPRGRVLTAPSYWEIRDERLPPTVQVPSDLSMGSDLSFTIFGQDPNGEDEPDISVEQPAFGDLTVTSVKKTKGGSSPVSLVQVSWTAIPASETGKTAILNVRTCVRDSSGYWENCVDSKVSVAIAPAPTPVPTPTPAAPTPPPSVPPKPTPAHENVKGN